MVIFFPPVSVMKLVWFLVGDSLQSPCSRHPFQHFSLFPQDLILAPSVGPLRESSSLTRCVGRVRVTVVIITQRPASLIPEPLVRVPRTRTSVLH